MTAKQDASEAELRKALDMLNGVGPSLEEVTVVVEGVVQNAVYHAKQTKEDVLQDVMHIRIGSRSPSMSVRYNSSALEVAVQQPYEGVKKIRFPAIIALEQGDRFRAYLVAADEKCNRATEPFHPDTYFFVRRELKSEEDAIKIEKLRGHQVIAAYIAE